ncbi:MAG: bacterioferritin [Pseudomonadota bacterium]
MKGDAKIIEYLNLLLKQELTTINQYFLHARMYKDWGFERLAKIEYEESIDEMKHADVLIERILFLEGLPNLQDLDRLFIGESIKECIECDLKAEHRAHPTYVEAIAYAETVKDYVTRDVLQKILDSEEEHIDWLETQLDRISKIGEERYMQSMMNAEAGPA